MKKYNFRKTALLMAGILVLQSPIAMNANIKLEAEEKRNNEIKSIEKILSKEEVELYSEPERQLEDLKVEEQEILSRRSATRPQTIQEMQGQGGNYSYQEVLPQSINNLLPEKAQEIERIKEEAISDIETSVEKIRQLDKESFDVAVKEVLDSFYEDINQIDQEKIDTFVQSLGEESESMAKGYKAALKERQNADSLDYETEQILVAFKGGTSYEEIREIADRLSGEIKIVDGTNKELSDYMAEGRICTEGFIAKIGIGIGRTVSMAKETLQEIDCITAIDFNRYMSVDEASYSQANDPGKNEQYSLAQVNVDGAWDAVTDALGYCDYKNNKAVIAIIDSGFDINHDELKNILSKRSITTGEKDADNNFKSLFECDIPYYTGHGSHVAGIIAAETNNNAGMVGITNIYDPNNQETLNLCEIIGINAGVASSEGKTLISIQGEIDGIMYAIENGADVINMSFGADNEGSLQKLALQKAHEAGVVLVASAGNKNTNVPHYPSSSEHVISVAWLAEDGITKHAHSNYGSTVDISAPGTGIYSCFVGDASMAKKSGTSMAAPVVTAAVGLMRAVNQQLTPEEIENILYTTATDLYSYGWDENSGYGRVDIGKAVSQAKIKAAPAHRKTTYDAQCCGYKNFEFTLSFEINPLIDFYEIYRAETEGTLGEKVYTVKNKDISDGKAIFNGGVLQDGKTYYYTVVGRIKNEDGNGYGYTEFLNEAYDNQIKVECVSPEIYLSKASSSEYSLSVNFRVGSQLCTIERSESEWFDANVMSIPVFRMSFDDQTAEKGKGYYYRAFVSYDKDNVKYYSKYSNTVYIKVCNMPQPPSVP